MIKTEQKTQTLVMTKATMKFVYSYKIKQHICYLIYLHIFFCNMYKLLYIKHEILNI